MDDELRQAYETLGLPENASREQVENRYFLLLKKAKSGQIELDEINRAYKRIIGFESEKEAPAGKQGKVAYFFYYYKFHVMAAVVALILIFVTVKGIVDKRIEEANKPPLDLAVTVYGNFFGTDTDRLSQNLLARSPGWKRIDVELAYTPAEAKSEQDLAFQQKAMLILATEKMDLMVLDETNFERLAGQQAFAPLDSLPIWSDLQKEQGRIRTALAEENTTARPYGIDITGHPVFQGTQIEAAGEKQILAVRSTAVHLDKAMALFKLLAASP